MQRARPRVHISLSQMSQNSTSDDYASPVVQFDVPTEKCDVLQLAEQAFVRGEPPCPAVARTVSFDLGKSKMLYLSMGVD